MLDCFHPSLTGHQWISKTIWNQMFVPQDQKPIVFKFDKQEALYCLTDSDRIVLHYVVI
ncbi:hypothetical protein BDF21DRAFT_250292 [Thamnidium elegans]|nr:hypothetical protein BDF21DRAFT_250292 [Thamnidium elegans]